MADFFPDDGFVWIISTVRYQGEHQKRIRGQSINFNFYSIAWLSGFRPPLSEALSQRFEGTNILESTLPNNRVPLTSIPYKKDGIKR